MKLLNLCDLGVVIKSKPDVVGSWRLQNVDESFTAEDDKILDDARNAGQTAG